MSSLVQNAVNQALGALASATGCSLQYRTSPTGSWLPLPGALFIPSDPMPIMFESDHKIIVAPMTGTLRIPSTTGLPLLNAGYSGAQIKDQNGVEWAVISVNYRVSHTQYACKRVGVVDAGPAAGRV